MTIQELIIRYPELYHLAADCSWLSIKKHGLLSTSALLTKWEYSGEEREKIECKWRPRRITIHHREYGIAVIRDQIPMPPHKLRECLTGGMEPEDWYESVNKRVFFWVTWRDLQYFLAAKQYCNKPQLVIAVDTRRLLERHANKITLSSINSGSTYSDRYGEIKKRGRETFKVISEYNSRYIKELVLEDGIPDIVEIKTSVTRWKAHKQHFEEEPIYEKLENVCL